jgi:hypothetical protein
MTPSLEQAGIDNTAFERGQKPRSDETITLPSERPANNRFRSLNRLPIRLVLSYLGLTFSAFILGPFDWPVNNWAVLVGFLAAVTLALYAGFRVAIAGQALGKPLSNWRVVILAGAIANIGILFPSAYLYTGKMPWDILTALQDQQAAYQELQQMLLLTEDSRTPLVLARIAAAPLVFAVIPLSILNWGGMSAWLRIFFFASICATLVFSVLRGTDREIADLALVLFSSTLVKFARWIVHQGVRLGQIVRRYRVGLICALLALFLAAAVFIDRKEGRVGDTRAFCFSETAICADFDSPPLGVFSERIQFAFVMAAAYASNGYYGLSLALGLNFQSTFGLGHAPFAMKAYSALAASDELYERSYTFRLRNLGWDDLSLWSTMFPWIANDISFSMVPPFMGLIGWMFGTAWKDSVFAQNDKAAIVFTFIILMMAYVPANSQLTLVADNYFAFVIWVVWWLWDRSRSRGINLSGSIEKSGAGAPLRKDDL